MKAVIQAGGKGTRINSVTGDKIPKPMIEIDNKPLLYYQIMNLKKYNIKDIIIIVGHLGYVISDYFKDGKELGVNISYVFEDPDNPLGTAGSLYYLKDKINGDYIFLLADIFIDVNFRKMIKFHKEHKGLITLFTHPGSHPYDSDLVVVDKDNKVLSFDYKTNDRSGYDYHNLVNAGIMIFAKETLDYIKELKKYNYEKDIVVPLIEKGLVYSYKSSEYSKDVGTPERYEAALIDYKSGIIKKKNLSRKQKAIFLDRDGTINKLVGYLTNKDDFELIDGVIDAIRKINRSEYLCIVITNQPIIARGDSTVDNLEEIHKRMETILGREGVFIHELYYCPHHPDKGFPGEVPELKIDCECRKPKIGMLTEASKDFNIDLSKSFVIGDSTSDIMMAKNAGCKSILLNTGEAGNDCKFDVKSDMIANDLLDAINMII